MASLPASFVLPRWSVARTEKEERQIIKRGQKKTEGATYKKRRETEEEKREQKKRREKQRETWASPAGGR